MQLFTHLLSSYLQGMGDFFSALALPKGRELLPAVFEAFRQDSFPLGKVGMGLLLVRFALAAGW